MVWFEVLEGFPFCYKYLLIFGAPFASRLLDLSRARVYFPCAAIAIAKIRDYSQSS